MTCANLELLRNNKISYGSFLFLFRIKKAVLLRLFFAFALPLGLEPRTL